MSQAETAVTKGAGNASVAASGVFLFAGGAIALMILYRMGPPSVDPDLWHEMALAREIVATGTVPWSDSFAYTPTVTPVVHHEWGAGLIAYGLSRAMGPAGIVLLRLALASLIVVFPVMTARRRGASAASLTLLTPIAALLLDAGFATVRAQMYSMAMVGLMVYLLERDRAGERWWIALWLPLYVLWLNVHAGFLVGSGLFAVEWLSRAARRQPQRHLLATGIAMGLLVMINPWGPRYYEYLVRATRMVRPRVVEWWPLSNEPADFALFLLATGLAVYAYSMRETRRRGGAEMLLVAAIEAARHTRLLLFFAILWFAFVPAGLDATKLGEALRDAVRRQRVAFAGIWAVLAVLFGVMLIQSEPWRLRIPEQPTGIKGATHYPVAAVEFLRAMPFQGNIMVPFDWGGYVSYQLAPDCKVSIDGRYEVAFPIEWEEESFRFFLATPGWQATLAKYPTDVVLAPIDLPVIHKLESLGWRRIHADDAFAVFARPGLALPSGPPSLNASVAELSLSP